MESFYFEEPWGFSGFDTNFCETCSRNNCIEFLIIVGNSYDKKLCMWFEKSHSIMCSINNEFLRRYAYLCKNIFIIGDYLLAVTLKLENEF